jgi:hypothetical protein
MTSRRRIRVLRGQIRRPSPWIYPPQASHRRPCRDTAGHVRLTAWACRSRGGSGATFLATKAFAAGSSWPRGSSTCCMMPSRRCPARAFPPRRGGGSRYPGSSPWPPRSPRWCSTSSPPDPTRPSTATGPRASRRRRPPRSLPHPPRCRRTRMQWRRTRATRPHRCSLEGETFYAGAPAGPLGLGLSSGASTPPAPKLAGVAADTPSSAMTR